MERAGADGRRMSRPAMLFYGGDWMSDTAHLDDHEERAYFRLVWFYWTRGSLPTDDKRLAEIAHQTLHRFKKMRPILLSFFSENWQHKRIEKELEKHHRYIATQRLNSAKGHAVRYAKGNGAGLPRARVPKPILESLTYDPTLGVTEADRLKALREAPLSASWKTHLKGKP